MSIYLVQWYDGYSESRKTVGTYTELKEAIQAICNPADVIKRYGHGYMRIISPKENNSNYHEFTINIGTDQLEKGYIPLITYPRKEK